MSCLPRNPNFVTSHSKATPSFSFDLGGLSVGHGILQLLQHLYGLCKEQEFLSPEYQSTSLPVVPPSPPSSLLLIQLRPLDPPQYLLLYHLHFLCAPDLSLGIVFPFSSAPLFLCWAELKPCYSGPHQNQPYSSWLSGNISPWVSLRGEHSFWQGEGNLTSRLQPSKKFAPNQAFTILLKDLALQPFNCACDKDIYGQSCHFTAFQKALWDLVCGHWLSWSLGTQLEKENKRPCFGSMPVHPPWDMGKCPLAQKVTVCSLPSPKDPLHLN